MRETLMQQEAQQVTMQSKYIDEQGNVLGLNEERFHTKTCEAPRYKNKPNGLGIYNFLKVHILRMTPKRWRIAQWLYRVFLKYAHWLKEGGWKGDLYRRVVMLYPPRKRNTGTVIMPLNVDITDNSKKTVIPMDVLKETIRKADFIAGMDHCLCRVSNDCKEYPHDLGCLFFSDLGRTAVKNGLAREFTVEEAFARVDKAAELGIMAQGVWLEFEQLLWGVRNDQMDGFFEVCFCCPCCCIAMNLAEHLSPDEKVLYHTAGWTAVPDRTRCVGCKRCVADDVKCLTEAISIGQDGKVVVNQDICVGCGECVKACNLGVLKLKQTMPMRENLQEYFDKELNIKLRIVDQIAEE